MQTTSVIVLCSTSMPNAQCAPPWAEASTGAAPRDTTDPHHPMGPRADQANEPLDSTACVAVGWGGVGWGGVGWGGVGGST